MSEVRPEDQTFVVRLVTPEDRVEWFRVRTALWPEDSKEHHASEMAEYAVDETKVVYVAARRSGGLAGFVEASIRAFADGCETGPVGYIEGWYVDPDARRQGVGSDLLGAAENWARRRGCVEMGSDCVVENDVSRTAHLALGYEERERLIHFRKWLLTRAATPGISDPRSPS